MGINIEKYQSGLVDLLEYLEVYKNENGNLNVQQSYKVKFDKTGNEVNFPLGARVVSLRRTFKEHKEYIPQTVLDILNDWDPQFFNYSQEYDLKIRNSNIINSIFAWAEKYEYKNVPTIPINIVAVKNDSQIVFKDIKELQDRDNCFKIGLAVADMKKNKYKKNSYGNLINEIEEIFPDILKNREDQKVARNENIVRSLNSRTTDTKIKETTTSHIDGDRINIIESLISPGKFPLGMRLHRMVSDLNKNRCKYTDEQLTEIYAVYPEIFDAAKNIDIIDGKVYKRQPSKQRELQ